MTDRRRPGQRAGLSRAAVLDAAGAVLAERGVAGLSMRGVAARLEVRPNALYSHVSSKDGLVDDLLDDALGAVTPPAADASDPREALRALFSETYGVLRARAELVPALLVRQGARGPNARALGDVTLALLARAGVTGADAEAALRVLIVHTIGVAAFDGHAPGDGPATDVGRSLDWLLAGILSSG